jgi:WD40 repeat protein
MFLPQSPENLRTQSLFLADLARQQNERASLTQAILLALEALPKEIAKPDRPYVPEAEIQLYEAVASQRERFILQGYENGVRHATFSPDGTRIVTASLDNTARVWESESGQELTVLRGHEDEVYYLGASCGVQP